MDNHTTRRPGAGLIALAAAFILAAASGAGAQGYGRIISDADEEAERPIRPYLMLNLGYGDPTDDAYSLAFSRPYFRFGGGFGMKFYSFGAEVILRYGRQEETRVVASSPDDAPFRTFYISTTEVQFRLLVRPQLGKASFPTGVGIGMASMTIDRGYPGVFDRFSGSGLYIGPFAGIEYPVGDMFAIGVEAEYAISESNFTGSRAWENQHSPMINGRGGSFPATEDDFWDTVGESGDSEFTNGGLIVSIRATMYIPTFSGND